MNAEYKTIESDSKFKADSSTIVSHLASPIGDNYPHHLDEICKKIISSIEAGNIEYYISNSHQLRQSVKRKDILKFDVLMKYQIIQRTLELAFHIDNDDIRNISAYNLFTIMESFPQSVEIIFDINLLPLLFQFIEKRESIHIVSFYFGILYHLFEKYHKSHIKNFAPLSIPYVVDLASHFISKSDDKLDPVIDKFYRNIFYMIHIFLDEYIIIHNNSDENDEVHNDGIALVTPDDLDILYSFMEAVKEIYQGNYIVYIIDIIKILILKEIMTEELLIQSGYLKLLYSEILTGCAIKAASESLILCFSKGLQICQIDDPHKFINILLEIADEFRDKDKSAYIFDILSAAIKYCNNSFIIEKLIADEKSHFGFMTILSHVCFESCYLRLFSSVKCLIHFLEKINNDQLTYMNNIIYSRRVSDDNFSIHDKSGINFVNALLKITSLDDLDLVAQSLMKLNDIVNHSIQSGFINEVRHDYLICDGYDSLQDLLSQNEDEKITYLANNLMELLSPDKIFDEM
ncbi:hypothetical protein TRFO_36784 [Tritrichomonas foetus]|uniref:Uncharacterized protein n=1 Tax=Tritrichomonas foetus TaxID=1144522 RepID=A0A1J4JCX7_9EUKA|nr:hypothetical protein TRFO_36784 [Tritrichomonas foetus]|eukprot:OHS97038.1 hypothetical protein TRFO_36784 [Tritrichomonas foetus]